MAWKISESTIEELKYWFKEYLKKAKNCISWKENDDIRDINNTIQVENNRGNFWGQPDRLRSFDRQRDGVEEWAEKRLNDLNTYKENFEFMLTLMRWRTFDASDFGKKIVYNFWQVTETEEPYPQGEGRTFCVSIIGFHTNYGRYEATFYAEKATIKFDRV